MLPYFEKIKLKMSFHTFVVALISLISFAVAILILCDSNRPSYYFWLFLLPLAFGAVSIVFNKVYECIPSNIGGSLVILLLFCRSVISPMFMRFGDYSGTIVKRIEKNTFYAILLVIYELIAIFTVLWFLMRRKKPDCVQIESSNTLPVPKFNKIYIWLVIAMLVILIVCALIVPQIVTGYRTILGIFEETFSHYEDAHIYNEFGDTFSKKLAIVIGQYLMRAVLIIVPALFIILLARHRNIWTRILAFIICLTPCFFIGGAIGRSLIYMVCLLLLYNYMFFGFNIDKKIIIIFTFAVTAVMAWWLIRSVGNTTGMSLYSRIFSSYFSGVNVVSGVFNLPNVFEYKLRYLIYDFTSTIPFGNTLFGIENMTIQPFFNVYNASQGQIPTTIGMGYYYFGPVLAPLYSVIFAVISFRSGEQFDRRLYENPYKCIRLLLMVFYFSMGIVMYNIEITLTNFFSLFLPMYIMEWISYKKWKEWRKK